MSGDSTSTATDDTNTTSTDDATKPPAGGEDTTDWKAEAEKAKADAEKWKGLSRKNETDLKALQKTAEKATQAGMSDAEKAIAEAKVASRKEAAVEFGRKLAAAELKAAAAVKGVDLSDIVGDLDFAKFVGDDGEVDTDAINKAVARFAKLAPAKKAPPASGADLSGGSGAGTPITEEQLAKMSPAEIQKAYDEGKLKHLM